MTIPDQEITWDWREEPPMGEINAALAAYGVTLETVDTGSDDVAVRVVAIDSPRVKNGVPAEFQRLWEACVTLSDKAAFGAAYRHLDFVEQGWRGARGTLRALLDRYVELVESGDCGSWDPEEEAVVIAARAALANSAAADTTQEKEAE